MKKILILLITLLVNSIIYSQVDLKDSTVQHLGSTTYSIVREKKMDTLFTDITYPITIEVITRIDYNRNGTIAKQLTVVQIFIYSRNQEKIDRDYILNYPECDTFMVSIQSYETEKILEKFHLIERYFIEQSKKEVFHLIYSSKRARRIPTPVLEQRILVIYPE